MMGGTRAAVAAAITTTLVLGGTLATAEPVAAADGFRVTSITTDRSGVAVSGLATVPVRYTVTIENGMSYGSYAYLRLRQQQADGSPSAPNTVNVLVQSSRERPDVFTGTLDVPATVGPQLVPVGMAHPEYDDPGEICMISFDSPECGGLLPASGPALRVTAVHRPRLSVSTVPAVTALPANAPNKTPRVTLTASLVDSDTGRPLHGSQGLVVSVTRRSHNDACRHIGGQGTTAILSRAGTARWTTSGASQHGFASALDDGPWCAVLLRPGQHPAQVHDPLAYVDTVARFTVPVSVKAPSRWRSDRSIPISASVRTYAGRPGTMRVQRLYGRSVWRTVGLTTMRHDGALTYTGAMRIPAKGRGMAVYRVQVFSADDRTPMTTSTSPLFRIR